MAQHWTEGVSTLRFTAREFQQELVEAARSHNVIACPPRPAASFVALKVIQELAYQIRRPSNRRTVILTVTLRLKLLALDLCLLTDLKAAACVSAAGQELPWNEIYKNNEVLVMTSEVLNDLLDDGFLSMAQINLLVIEECHTVATDPHLQRVMDIYSQFKYNTNYRNKLSIDRTKTIANAKGLDDPACEAKRLDGPICVTKSLFRHISETTSLDEIICHRKESNKQVSETEELNGLKELDRPVCETKGLDRPVCKMIELNIPTLETNGLDRNIHEPKELVRAICDAKGLDGPVCETKEFSMSICDAKGFNGSVCEAQYRYETASKTNRPKRDGQFESAVDGVPRILAFTYPLFAREATSQARVSWSGGVDDELLTASENDSSDGAGSESDEDCLENLDPLLEFGNTISTPDDAATPSSMNDVNYWRAPICDIFESSQKISNSISDFQNAEEISSFEDVEKITSKSLKQLEIENDKEIVGKVEKVVGEVENSKIVKESNEEIENCDKICESVVVLENEIKISEELVKVNHCNGKEITENSEIIKEHGQKCDIIQKNAVSKEESVEETTLNVDVIKESTEEVICEDANKSLAVELVSLKEQSKKESVDPLRSPYDKLECQLEKLEKMLCSEVDMASDIVGLKRITGRPTEVILEYKSSIEEQQTRERRKLESFMRQSVRRALSFITDHRFDPTEIYSDEAFGEELRAIPDPVHDPRMMLEQFLYILEQTGPYGADKAAFALLVRIEKLKVKIPYERHFLLLCLVSSILVQVRAAAEMVFEKLDCEQDRIKRFTTPKVLRLVEIFRLFVPVDSEGRGVDASLVQALKDKKHKGIEVADGTVKKASAIQNDSSKTSGGDVCKVSESKNKCRIVNMGVVKDDLDKRKYVSIPENTTEFEKNGGLNIKDSTETSDKDVEEVKIDVADEINQKIDVLPQLNDPGIMEDGLSKFCDSQNGNSSINPKVGNSIDQLNNCDFIRLSNRLELSYNSILDKEDFNTELENNLKILDDIYKKNDLTVDLRDVLDAYNVINDSSVRRNVIDEELKNIRAKKDLVEKCKNLKNEEISVLNTEIISMNGVKDECLDRNLNGDKIGAVDVCEIFDKRLEDILKNEDLPKYKAEIIPSVSTEEDCIVQSSDVLIITAVETCKVDDGDSAIGQNLGLKNDQPVCDMSKNDSIDKIKPKEQVQERTIVQSAAPKLHQSPRRARMGDGHVRGRGRGRGGRGHHGNQNRYYQYGANNDPDALCGLVFVEDPLMAKILCTLINEYCRSETQLRFVTAQYTVDKVADPVTEPRDAETEHRLQEEVLKRFRIHECNVLVGTAVLEEGMDLPKCNLVVRWDAPTGYRSHARCRARARAPRSLYAMLAPPSSTNLVSALARYTHVERMLVKKCGWKEPPASEEAHAAKFGPLVQPYRPNDAAVTLSTAVQLLNRYCAKLPSDTFTRLVPLWSMESIQYGGRELFICTIRLPINCPLKHHIVGHPMPTRVLARRIAALQACRALHRAGELDDNLLPIGKESFRALEPDWLSLPPASDINISSSTTVAPAASPEVAPPTNTASAPLAPIGSLNLSTDTAVPGGCMANSQIEPRPGTTKRKQYYYKKVARSLCDCRPIAGELCLAYSLKAWLACPLPERHNTRGRKLHPPEAYSQGLAILTTKAIHEIPVFPMFTRSGEVQVSLSKMEAMVRISARRARLIHRFMRYTFADVLRVRNHLMVFDAVGREKGNSYYVVPTTKANKADGSVSIVVDWEFLELIYEHTNALRVQSIPEAKSSVESEGVTAAETVEIEGSTVSDECKVHAVVNDQECDTNDVNSAGVQNIGATDCSVDVEKVIDNGVVTDIDNQEVCVDVSRRNTDEELVKGVATLDVVKDLLPDVNELKTNGSNSEEASLKKELDCKETCIGKPNDEIDSKTDGIDEKVSADIADKLSEVAEQEFLQNPYLVPGETFVFDSEKYRDAVVMPWYRNQDQPQYFYVAEICWNLSPLSGFPSSQHSTFADYYRNKYGAVVTQPKQPLLDVDHTSARLNLLTPRFVNRKGVALPTSSERTKKAHRESLEQKQILVPELCGAHPFRGALWRAAVALPCVLYRINSLLLADEIRRSVASKVALGTPRPPPGRSWPPLDFGWSLADVLTGDTAKTSEGDEKNESADNKKDPPKEIENKAADGADSSDKTVNDILKEKEDADNGTDDVFEIGTWTNDMAASVNHSAFEEFDDDDDDMMAARAKLPGNLTICTTAADGGVDWSLSSGTGVSPKHTPRQNNHRKYSVADSDASYVSSDFDQSDDGSNSSGMDSDDDDDDDIGDQQDLVSERGGIRIEFKSGNEAEAIDVLPASTEKSIHLLQQQIQLEFDEGNQDQDSCVEAFKEFFYGGCVDEEDEHTKQHIAKFRRAIVTNEVDIVKNGVLIGQEKSLESMRLQELTANLNQDPMQTSFGASPTLKLIPMSGYIGGVNNLSKDLKSMSEIGQEKKLRTRNKRIRPCRNIKRLESVKLSNGSENLSKIDDYSAKKSVDSETVEIKGTMKRKIAEDSESAEKRVKLTEMNGRKFSSETIASAKRPKKKTMKEAHKMKTLVLKSCVKKYKTRCNDNKYGDILRLIRKYSSKNAIVCTADIEYVKELLGIPNNKKMTAFKHLFPKDLLHIYNGFVEKESKNELIREEDLMNRIEAEEDKANPIPDVVEKAMSKREIVDLYAEMFPYEKLPSDSEFDADFARYGLLKHGCVSLEDIELNKRKILNEIKNTLPADEWKKFNFFAMKDLDEQHFSEKFSDAERAAKMLERESDDLSSTSCSGFRRQSEEDSGIAADEFRDSGKVAKIGTSDAKSSGFSFSFDYQPDLKNHPGPSPSIILQALTMSNANDGINLERLETIGDSFLKYAITTYLYCTYQNIHEGKLSHLRSKQVSNLNLYRLGRRKSLGCRMVACKFEPHDNWLPPCHRVPAHLERALIDTKVPSTRWNVADMPSLKNMSKEDVERLVKERFAEQNDILHYGNSQRSLMGADKKINRHCPVHGDNNANAKLRLLDTVTEDSPEIEDKNDVGIVKTCPKKDDLMDLNDRKIRVETIEIDDVEKFEIGEKMADPEAKEDEGKTIDKEGKTVTFKDKTLAGYNSVTPLCTCCSEEIASTVMQGVDDDDDDDDDEAVALEGMPCYVPYNLITQHSIPDKSVADCVEALIGAYLIECGPRGALLFMAWLGIRVLPKDEVVLRSDHPFIKAMTSKVDRNINAPKETLVGEMASPIDEDRGAAIGFPCDDDEDLADGLDGLDEQNFNVVSDGDVVEEGESDFEEAENDDGTAWEGRVPGSLKPYLNDKGEWVQVVYGELLPPPSPLLRFVPDPEGELTQMLSGYEGLEETLCYRFRDRCYLLQAMTHASYSPNRLTDCYQRLEFLGDAVLDYLITRQLYEDPRRHSPGALTDLRSALVNNTIFASLAVRHGMHKYFRHLSPGLNEVLARFVRIQESNGHSISEEYCLMQEDECEQAEDVEVPKALGDLFESVAGAIFLDSGMSLDAVWKVYHRLMQREIEAFSESVPKSPVRELLEMEPETAKFGKPEKLADGRRVRVTVEVLGAGAFKGVGRNYRIAKCTAAKCALRHLAGPRKGNK